MGINTRNWDGLDTGWELSASSSEFGIELPCSISHGVRHINKKIIKIYMISPQHLPCSNQSKATDTREAAKQYILY